MVLEECGGVAQLEEHLLCKHSGAAHVLSSAKTLVNGDNAMHRICLCARNHMVFCARMDGMRAVPVARYGVEVSRRGTVRFGPSRIGSANEVVK